MMFGKLEFSFFEKIHEICGWGIQRKVIQKYPATLLKVSEISQKSKSFFSERVYREKCSVSTL